jgi:phage-related protein
LRQDRKGYANCLARIQQLADAGYELRRPAADFLSEGIYELRAKHINVQYRILHFFHGQNVAILAHSLIKFGAAVSQVDINRAIERRHKFERNPDLHTFEMEANNEDE